MLLHIRLYIHHRCPSLSGVRHTCLERFAAIHHIGVISVNSLMKMHLFASYRNPSLLSVDVCVCRSVCLSVRILKMLLLRQLLSE